MMHDKDNYIWNETPSITERHHAIPRKNTYNNIPASTRKKCGISSQTSRIIMVSNPNALEHYYSETSHFSKNKMSTNEANIRETHAKAKNTNLVG